MKAKFEPPEGKVVFIVGQDNATIHEYVRSVGVIPAGFMIYTNISSMEGFSSRSPDYGSGTFFADELRERYPGTVLQVGLYMVDLLKGTIKGEFDGRIDEFALWCSRAKIPVFLRIGYECDGAHNRYDPADYRAAYRHIVDRLREKGVTNVAFVWHVHAHSTSPRLDAYYPGDDYVDWVAISYFNQPQDMMAPVLKYAELKKKPVMIGESTPMGIGSAMDNLSWEAWYKPFFQFIQDKNIKAVSYINSDWESQPMWKGQGWEDARVQANNIVKDLWMKEIGKEKYLHFTAGLFEALGCKP